MRLVLHTLILGNVLFGRAALVGCAPQGMDLLSAQIAMFVLFFSFSFFCAFSFVSVCFTFLSLLFFLQLYYQFSQLLSIYQVPRRVTQRATSQ